MFTLDSCSWAWNQKKKANTWEHTQSISLTLPCPRSVEEEVGSKCTSTFTTSVPSLMIWVVPANVFFFSLGMGCFVVALQAVPWSNLGPYMCQVSTRWPNKIPITNIFMLMSEVEQVWSFQRKAQLGHLPQLPERSSHKKAVGRNLDLRSWVPGDREDPKREWKQLAVTCCPVDLIWNSLRRPFSEAKHPNSEVQQSIMMARKQIKMERGKDRLPATRSFQPGSIFHSSRHLPQMTGLRFS